MTDAAIVIDNVQKTYAGGKQALKGVSFDVPRGSVFGLLGPNGAGKSTLINLLSGDIPASSGQVLYRGEDITALSPHQRSRIGIGRSYQKTNIFPGFTVFENCRLAAQSREPRGTRIFSNAASYSPYMVAVEEALDRTGLDDVAIFSRLLCNFCMKRAASNSRNVLLEFYCACNEQAVSF